MCFPCTENFGFRPIGISIIFYFIVEHRHNSDCDTPNFRWNDRERKMRLWDDKRIKSYIETLQAKAAQ